MCQLSEGACLFAFSLGFLSVEQDVAGSSPVSHPKPSMKVDGF